MDFSFDKLNYNSVENVPCIEARAAFTLNSATVFTPVGRGYSVVKEDVDNVPTIIDDTLILPDKKPQEPKLVNLTDYSVERPKGLLSFFTFIRFEEGGEIPPITSSPKIASKPINTSLSVSPTASLTCRVSRFTKASIEFPEPPFNGSPIGESLIFIFFYL